MADLPAFIAPVVRTSRIQITPLSEELSGAVRRPLLILWGAVTMVLLLICANMAGLQLARASARTGELALRAALGAGRTRLVRLLLGESLLVAWAGGVLGLAGAWWLVRVLRVLEALRLPAPDTIRVNTPVLLFASAVTLAAGVLAGLAPALTASRPDLQEAMKGSSRAGSSRRARRIAIGPGGGRSGHGAGPAAGSRPVAAQRAKAAGGPDGHGPGARAHAAFAPGVGAVSRRRAAGGFCPRPAGSRPLARGRRKRGRRQFLAFDQL